MKNKQKNPRTQNLPPESLVCYPKLDERRREGRSGMTSLPSSQTPRVKAASLEKDSGIQMYLELPHPLKFTALGVSRGPPPFIHSFPACLRCPRLALCSVGTTGSPRFPEGPIIKLRTFAGSRFYQHSLLSFQDAPSASSFSWTQALPDVWEFLPTPASLWPKSSLYKDAPGRAV